MATVYTEDQLVAHYRFLSDESKRRVTKVIANLSSVEKVEAKINREAQEAIKKDKSVEKELIDKRLLRCSFCDKPISELNHLIAGNGVYICDECAHMCVEVFEDPDVTDESDVPEE